MGNPALKQKVGDAALAAKTGKTWNEWFKVLDAAGARNMNHREIVGLLAKRHGVERGWWWQMVTVGYEQARGKRLKHEKSDGFEVSSSKTIAAPLAALYRAWTDPKLCRRWLPGAGFTVTTATPNKSIRIKWGDGVGRVSVMFYPRGGKNQVAVQHGKLPSAAAARKTQSYWKERLDQLQKILER